MTQMLEISKQKILPMTNRLNALVAKVGNKQYVSSE